MTPSGPGRRDRSRTAGSSVEDFARAVLLGVRLEDKLAAPPPGAPGPASERLPHAPRAAAGAHDGDAGTSPPPARDGPPAPLSAALVACRAPPALPGRPPSLAIRRGPATRVPPLAGMADPRQRARILHAFANHELQAIELFALGLLAFPHAPRELRAGLLATLADEQRHLRLYLDRLAAWDVAFGDFPVSGYLWGKAPLLTTLPRFLAVVGLTFEGANLDHTLDYAAAARAAGDRPTAELLATVHDDEVRHVRFAVQWLGRCKPAGESLGAAWTASLPAPLRPSRARGRTLHRLPRERAGFDETLFAALRRDDG